MRSSTLFASVALLAFSFGAVRAEERIIRISGFVGSVGSNLGTTIDGSFPDFNERDPFRIDLRFESTQAPTIIPAGTGQTASYNLLESTFTIFADEITYSWGFSTPLADNYSHSFGITNDYYLGSGTPQDKFTAGGSLPYTGPTLNGKAISHWQLTFYNNGGSTFSDTSVPSSLELSSYVKLLDMTFVGYMTGDQITFSVTNWENLPVTPVPEPSTWAAILGAAALGGVIWTRRRQTRA